jgi:hypothetical protein
MDSPKLPAMVQSRLIRGITTTMTELSGHPGFAPPRAEQTLSRRRAIALELIATGALTASLIIAATAVSMGDRSLVRANVIAERPSMQMPPLRR